MSRPAWNYNEGPELLGPGWVRGLGPGVLPGALPKDLTGPTAGRNLPGPTQCPGLEGHCPLALGQRAGLGWGGALGQLGRRLSLSKEQRNRSGSGH